MNRRAHLLWILAFAPLLAASLPDAHDDLRSATPGEGDTLRVVPDTLRLTFTRAQNLDLASVTLTGPGGEVALGRMRADPDSAARVLVPVEGPWAAGVHSVHWRIVGQDGHPVSGTYRFVVANGAEGLPTALPDSLAEGPAGGQVNPAERATEAEGGATGESTAGGGGFGVDSPLYVGVRWLGFAGLLGVLGAAAYGLVVLPLARRRAPELDVAHGRRAAATPGMVAAGLLVLATIGRLGAQVEAMTGPGEPSVALVATVLTATVWGTGWMCQMGAAVLALGAFVWARRSPGAVPWAVAGGATLVLAFTRGLSGHAVAVERFSTLAVLADGVHVLAAGGWMGGLLVVLLVAVPQARNPGKGALGHVVHAFSLTALACAALLVLTGVFASWLHLGGPEALWSSAYGRTLLLKLALLVPLLGIGAWNWRRVRPALARGEPAARHLRRSGGAELALAVGILLVTAVLVATPPPMEQDPERAAAPAPVAPAGSPGAATSP